MKINTSPSEASFLNSEFLKSSVQEKKIEFDTQQISKFDRELLKKLVDDDIINVSNTLTLSKQKPGEQDKNITVFNPPKKIRKNPSKVSFVPTPASPSKHTKHLEKVIGNLNSISLIEAS